METKLEECKETSWNDITVTPVFYVAFKDHPIGIKSAFVEDSTGSVMLIYAKHSDITSSNEHVQQLFFLTKHEAEEFTSEINTKLCDDSQLYVYQKLMSEELVKEARVAISERKVVHLGLGEVIYNRKFYIRDNKTGERSSDKPIKLW